MRRVDESWNDHLARLQSHKTKARRGAVGLQYRVVTTLVNAANFGVPQRRERVFMVGFRSDVDAQWSFRAETHSLDALLHDQWVSGDYWEQHRVAKRHRPEMPANHTGLIARLRGLGLPRCTNPGRPFATR